MFSACRDVFALPGALKFSPAGLIARLPLSVLGISLVLFIQGATGSYGLAGIVAAVYMTANAISNPILAKAIDRRDQAELMVPATVIHVASLALLSAPST